jgi:hypothetical protein
MSKIGDRVSVMFNGVVDAIDGQGIYIATDWGRVFVDHGSGWIATPAPAAPTRPPRRVGPSRPFAARFGGFCGDCGDTIEEGDPIVMSDGGAICEGCAT